MSQLQDYACASDRVMDVTGNNSIGIYVTTPSIGVSVSVPPLGYVCRWVWQWACPRTGSACYSLSSALLHVADLTQLDAASRLVGGAWGWGRE